MTFTEGAADLPHKKDTPADTAVRAYRSLCAIEAQAESKRTDLDRLLAGLTPAEGAEYAKRTGATS